MSAPAFSYRIPLRAGRSVAVTVLVVAVAACTGADGGATRDAGDAGPVVVGPLCERLPAGDDPGGPAVLVTEPADVALTWIPALTIFEAGARATGLDEELREADRVTILAPTDDAFRRTFSQDTLDDLLLFRQEELRALLEVHILPAAHSLADLRDAATVPTLGGDELTVTQAEEGMVRFDDRAETVCADYEVSNARIHIIDAILGELPEQTPPGRFDGS